MSESRMMITTQEAGLSPKSHTGLVIRRGWWSLNLILVLLFAQVWRDLFGFTFRLDDLVTLSMVGWWLFSSFRSGQFHFYRSRLNKPLTLWIAVIGLGIGVSLTQPLATDVKRDALVNGIRLMLAFCLYFVVNNHPLSAERKIHILFNTIIAFSLLTSAVALLQIAYWDGWLPFSLPAILTTFKEGADTERGREIFALFIGNTGTHSWSSMLAMQAMAVWLISASHRKWAYRLAGLVYFFVLCFILVRTSVRTSILGLGVAIFAILLIQAVRSRFPFNRLIKPLLMLGGVLCVLAIFLALAPQSYFLERVSQTIPQITSDGFVIDRGVKYIRSA